MALKTYSLKQHVPVKQRLLKIALRLKAGECYLARDVAAQLECTESAVLAAGKVLGASKLQTGARKRAIAVIVNPKHASEVES